MTPEQLRMGRAHLGISQGELAQEVGTSTMVISNAEAERTILSAEISKRIIDFFTLRGLELTDHNGIRETPTGIKIFKGKSGFKDFYGYQYNILRKYGGDIWLYNGVSKNFVDALDPEFLEIHKERMFKIKDKINYRVIVEEGEEVQFGSAYAEYRTVPSDQFNDKTIFVFHGVFAIVDFSDEILVTVIEKEEIAQTISQLMLNSWEKANVIHK